jgi:hypothetical protein
MKQNYSKRKRCENEIDEMDIFIDEMAFILTSRARACFLS